MKLLTFLADQSTISDKRCHMKMTQDEYEQYNSEHAGYCSDCDMVTTEGIEPDAEHCECPECGNSTVMGVENGLVYEHIEITDEGEDSEDVGIISFGDDDED